MLFRSVNQQEAPLPRQWSTIHKCQTLNLTNSNLRVTYKGPGKTHKDAASVRTDYPIPAACGIYYFEIKIISKGRDGYMGIGLFKSDVLLNRLSGWDKNSYGYHGDDGHSFCCSGTGQNYGPTFTTGDIIGCCLNLIENTCFYTKNGYNLGIAFRDLPSDLYPTVGLQTPMESVEANFGQYPFEFDIHNYVKEWHLKTRQTIEQFPLRKDVENNLPTTLRKLISTYLVHHGYSSTAEAFAKDVGHVFEEELASIRNRQRVQKLVLNGQIGEAIELTYQLFPGILERNPNLLFALKVRKFIEMVSNLHGNSSSSKPSSPSKATAINNNSTDNTEAKKSNTKSLFAKSNLINQTQSNEQNNNNNNSSSSEHGSSTNNHSMLVDNSNGAANVGSSNGSEADVNSKMKSEDNGHFHSNEEEMEMDSSPKHSLSSLNNSTENQLATSTNTNASKPTIKSESSSSDQNNNSSATLAQILEFGRELFALNTQFAAEHGDNPANTKMIRDAFSLLAYNEPATSPIGFQLEAVQREPISALLNSAILEANHMPRIPSLEVIYGQTHECVRLMAKYGVAWCAYVNLADYMQS